MKTDPRVIQLLNRVLTNELTAINQYFLHARMLKNWGMERLAEKERQESFDEMKHADALMQRILFLEGLPNLQNLNKLRIGENVLEILKADLAVEMDAAPLLRDGIKLTEELGDYVTRNLLREILSSEEEHIDFLETQLELYAKMGEQNYIQSATGSIGS